MQDLGERRMAVKVWHIKGLLKEIKVHHCHTCSPIISLWQVSAFHHNSASESRDASPILIAGTPHPRLCQGLRMVAVESTSACLWFSTSKTTFCFRIPSDRVQTWIKWRCLKDPCEMVGGSQVRIYLHVDKNRRLFKAWHPFDNSLGYI